MISLKLLFWLVTLVDISASVIIFFSALNARMLSLPLGYKIGLIIAAFGFAAQGGLNLPFLLFGIELKAQLLPFWTLKDLGIGIVAMHYFWQIIHDKRKPPQKRKKTMPTKAPTKTTAIKKRTVKKQSSGK